jgi:hypothetical protein
MPAASVVWRLRRNVWSDKYSIRGAFSAVTTAEESGGGNPE